MRQRSNMTEKKKLLYVISLWLMDAVCELKFVKIIR